MTSTTTSTKPRQAPKARAKKPTVKVLVTGSRTWTDKATIEAMFDKIMSLTDHQYTLIHGAAQGADTLAAEVATARRFHVESYPADWNHNAKGAGAARNRQMLDKENPDLVIAFKSGFDRTLSRGGTEHMVKIALLAGKVVYLVERPGCFTRVSLPARTPF